MALTRVVRTVAVSGGATSVTSAAFTPPNNSLVVLICLAMRQGTNAFDATTLAPTNSGSALTWTTQVLADGDAEDYGQSIVIFTAPVTTGASTTFTVTASTAAQRMRLVPITYEGYNTSTPTGVTGSSVAGPTDGAYTPSLSGSLTSDSEVIAAIAGTVTGGGDIFVTLGTGFTSLDTGNVAGEYGFQLQSRTGSTASTVTWDDVLDPSSTDTYYHASRYAALEIKAAATGPTTTNVTGSATAAVGIAETYTFTLDASPAGTVTVTPTAPVAGSWSPTTVGLTSGNWNTGLTSDFTASAAGSGNISSTNDGGLANDTLAVTVHPVSRPSAVTPNTWTDEAGGALVVADINDASDSTGAKDPAGASYPILAFTMDTPMAASVSQTCYFRGNDVVAGKQTRQVLFANDGTTVVATGAWHTMTGTLATYSDVLTPTATAYKGEIQTQAA